MHPITSSLGPVTLSGNINPPVYKRRSLSQTNNNQIMPICYAFHASCKDRKKVWKNCVVWSIDREVFSLEEVSSGETSDGEEASDGVHSGAGSLDRDRNIGAGRLMVLLGV